MLIGLTGKYCAGKNFIASLLEKRGIPVLDVDKLGYQALETEKEAIFAQFGFELKLPDDSIDRRALGKKVFGNPKKLAALEGIVHPTANRLTEEWIAKNEGQSLIINAALLHRSSVFNKLNHIIIVKAPFFTRLLRAKRRDKLPWIELFRRFASQKDFGSQYLAKNAEIYIVRNPDHRLRIWSDKFKSGKEDLEAQIDKFLEGIR